MKKKYNKFLLVFGLLVTHYSQAQETFSYTGLISTYIVPGGVSYISIETKGSKGLDDGVSIGGFGATMYGEFTVAPGDVLTYYVGGNSAGLHAGGDGTWVENTTTGTLLIVAGGGGGAAYDKPGTGAPTTNNGLTTAFHPGYTNGAGGIAGFGGGAGIGSWGTGGGGGWITAGSAGIGTPGGPVKCRASYGTTFAAGAGGGYSGGGGVDMDSGWGTGGGGAGGSYNVGANQDNVASNNGALGQIIIDFLCDALTVTVSDDHICLGESFTLTAEGEGIISWDGGVENGEPFTPLAIGTYTYNATSTSGTDCGYEIDIVVHANPTVTAITADSEVCEGDMIKLNGGGAAFYSWDLGVINNVFFTPPLGVTTYTVIGTSFYDCVGTAEITITVNEVPDVTASASDNEICLGESVVLTGSGATEYEWTPVGIMDGAAYTPGTVGTIICEVTGTDDNGCENTATTEITVFEAITITYTTVEEMLGADGSIDITVSGGNPAYGFDWNNDGTGDFDDTEDLTGLVGGSYIVVVQDEAGCSATQTIMVNSQLNINEQDGLQLGAYPNPTSGAINLLMNGPFTYEVTTITGDILFNGQAVDKAEFTLENLADGIYFINVNANGKINTVKVIKK